ncbi:MAG: GNAT family N-acetyltransferase [Clostridia bacterium]|nr:GNAT family N-acetyltransferase [Clostridia bacterium]
MLDLNNGTDTILNRGSDPCVKIRRAETRDIPALLALLSQVLELHAKIRPDIFVPGTTKYTETALAALLAEEEKPVYVAVDAVDRVLGYAFCVLKHAPAGGFIRSVTVMYIDDLCVDEAARGRGLGRMLFQHVTAEARRLGCYEITLNVWEGNDSARHFYESLGMSPKSTQMELILP